MGMIIQDKDLGKIRLVENIRARKIIVRKKDDHLQLTHPPFVTLAYIENAIERMKPRLLSLVSDRVDKFLFTPQTHFSTFSFTLQLLENEVADNYYMRLKDDVLTISCPRNTNYEESFVQNEIRGLVEKALRYEAKRLFPQRVALLAKKYEFVHSEVKINKSRTRWGSCSSKKNINLSFYCMLLPEYLVDFVLLHELCHTKEMNHGEYFWILLDKVSGGRARELTKELKNFSVNW